MSTPQPEIEPCRQLGPDDLIEHGDQWASVAAGGPCLFTIGMTVSEALRNFPWFMRFIRPARRRMDT